MSSDDQPPLHYNRGVMKMVSHVVLWLRRYRNLTTTLEQVLILASATAFLACDRNRLAPQFAIAIICVAMVTRGAWAAAMDGIKTCLSTQLSGIYMGLAIASIVVLLGKSYPQPYISRFAIELSYVAMFIAFWTHVYLGMFVDVAMTRQDQWQKGYVWRQQRVAAVRRWLRHQ
ncbi:hypothetical protein [Rhodopila sp.]|uniref:hypothetical protein n=1 Tax=Rhodopila sp. TaxID=2480087 RepID=UPI003D12DC8A